MAASLDDVVAELKDVKALLGEIRDSGGAGSGTAGGSGLAQKAAGGAGGIGLPGFGKGALGVAAAASKIPGQVSRALDSLGVTAGLRASSLGASQDEAVARGGRALARSALSLPFAGFALAHTAQTLGAQEKAQQDVSGLLEAGAMAGLTRADVNVAGIDEQLKRQNELRGNQADLRELVASRQAIVGKEEFGKAVGKDAGFIADLIEPIKSLGFGVTLLEQALRETSANLGGTR